MALRRTISRLAMLLLLLLIAGEDAKGGLPGFININLTISSHYFRSPLIPVEPFTYGTLAICVML
jgi:hypothetical protein